MSFSSVSPKKRVVLEDGLSKMQKQMEFMFGEMMSRFEDRFEKLETKVESGLGKKGREAMETLQKESKMILTVVVRSVHIEMTCIRLGQGAVEFG
jgi:DNA anti-recombination protein RmuC